MRLEVNGRAHRSKEAYRAIAFAKTLGFDQLNIDLIAGMMDETPDNWERCVRTAIEQQPDCVTIYQMEIPFNTTIYKEMKESGRVTAPVADWRTKRAWVDWAFDQFEAAGYTVSSAYTVVKNPETTKFVYRDSLWAGADLLSAGVASFGHFGGIHYQNQADVGPYMTEVDAGGLPIFRAYPTNHEERFIREFILQLKLGHTNRGYFRKKYGEELPDLRNARQRAHWNRDPQRIKQSVPPEPAVQQVHYGNQKRAANKDGIRLSQHPDDIVNVDFFLQPEHRRESDEQLDQHKEQFPKHRANNYRANLSDQAGDLIAHMFRKRNGTGPSR